MLLNSTKRISDATNRFNVLDIAVKTSFVCATALAITGALLLAGLWKLLLTTILRINPVSAEFEIKLSFMIQNLGLLFFLLGAVILLATLILSDQENRPKRDTVLIGALVFIAILFFAQMQPLIELNNHRAWDGGQYYAMFHWFRCGAFPVEAPFGKMIPVFPYSQRVLIPWLAEFIPFSDSMSCFRVVNVVFLTTAGATMYYLWAELCRLPKWLSLAGILFFTFHWVSPVRGLNNCVYSVDAPVYLFESLMLCVVFTRKFKWLLLLAPLATLCKEQFVYVFLVFLIYSLIYNWLKQKRLYPIYFLGFTFLMTVLVSSFAMRFPFHGTGFGGFTVAFFAWTRLCEPLGFVRWTIALMTAYGVLGLMAMIVPKVRQNEHELLLSVLSVLFLIFSMLGATDMTRTAFLGFPFVMTWVLMRIKSQPWQQNVLAIVLTVPVMRLVTSIPEPANPLPNNDITGAYSWVPEYAHLSIVVAWGLYFILCWILLSKKSSPLGEQQTSDVNRYAAIHKTIG